MSVAYQISYYDVTIITAAYEGLTALLNDYSIAGVFVLFHDVPYRTLGVLWGVLIMDKHLTILRNAYYPSRVPILVIVYLVGLGCPVGQVSYDSLVALEVLHFGSVLDIYCKYLSLAVSYKKLPLSGV